MKESKSARKAKRRARSDTDMIMHMATPTMDGITLTKLKNKNAKPVNKAARLIVTKLKKR